MTKERVDAGAGPDAGQARGQSGPGKRKRVILVTDGDRRAQEAVETAAGKLGLRCISNSAGNPTPLLGSEIVEMVHQTPTDPVLVMVDDRGAGYQGRGESALAFIARDPSIQVLGAVAVASDTWWAVGADVDASVTRDGHLVDGVVDKGGDLDGGGQERLQGDTVDILNDLNVPIIVGVGDIGKMHGSDSPNKGAPITVKAIQTILKRSGLD